MIRCIQAESICFAYSGGPEVLSHVNATVRSGWVAGIVGPNGSGKSTLLRVLCGLLKPRAGRVTLDAKPLSSYSGVARARVLAFLPQTVEPAFSLTAFEVVCLGRYPHLGPLRGLGARDREVAERCLKDTETEPLRNREFLTLSGGERQRVLLASILAQEPDLLLLDEPTSALDIHHQIEIFGLLRRLARDGYGIAVVTHDLGLAARFCNTLVLLSAGKTLLASGPPNTVLTEELLSRAYAAPIRVAEHPGTRTPLIWAEEPKDNDL